MSVCKLTIGTHLVYHCVYFIYLGSFILSAYFFAMLHELYLQLFCFCIAIPTEFVLRPKVMLASHMFCLILIVS